MRLLLPTVLLATVALGACVSSPSAPHQAPSTSSQARLQALIAHAWQQEMANNPVEASLDGDHRYDDRWSDPSLKQQQREIGEMQANLATLEKIDATQLSPAEQLNYRLFAYQLKDNLAGAELRDSDQGLITQLWGPQLMAGTVKQLRFDSLADYQNWLKRLQTFGAYLQAYTQRLQQAVNKGITQPRIVMQRVPAEIEGAISKDPTKSGFYAPFKQMPSTIPTGEQAKLRAAAKQAITHVVNPAYEKFATFFKTVYLPHARKQIGVSSLPDGKTYYTYLVKHFTTTNMTPQQIHELGLKQVKRIHGEMQAVFTKIGFKGSYKDFLHYLRTNPKFYYKDPQALLEAYRAATKRVDPNLVKIAGTWLLPRVPYGVRPIPAALAPNTYPAYSVPPAGDGSVAGYVGVNLYKPETRPKYDIQVLMCHEGRPGHQLQIPIAMQLKNLPPFRRFAYYNVYGEGWALYSETLCNKPLGLYDNPYSKFGYLNYQMWRAVRLVVDTGIHYYGWSREKAVHYMQDNTALADQNINTEVDRYIVWPGQALSYMIGEMHILKLRAEAEQKLGDKYSLRDFDDVVLGEGSLPMAVLTTVVNRWIARTLAGTPADQLPYADKPRSLGSDSNSAAVDPPAVRSTAGNAGADTSRPTTYIIQKAELESPTVLKLEYSAGYAPCYGKLERVEVQQSAQRVTVTLHRSHPEPANAHQMCPHYLMLKWTTVTLDSALAKRTIIDGSTGKPVSANK
ncbi:MAG: DUF885 domain-containing protein [Gammaproteobacteria bacterium]